MSSKLDPRQPGDDVTTTEPVEQEYRTFGEAMSPTIGELAGAMAKAQGAMNNGVKDKEGYGYKYMTLASLIDIARKPLSDNGIAILQSHELIRSKVPTVVTHTTVMHSSGEWHKSSLELPIKIMPNLSLSQMVGVAASYGRRYSHQALVQVTGEEDTDGV
jgi:hypothetical protein